MDGAVHLQAGFPPYIDGADRASIFAAVAAISGFHILRLFIWSLPITYFGNGRFNPVMTRGLFIRVWSFYPTPASGR